MFFFPKKVLDVDVFTSSANVYEYTPIVPAYKCIPKWWKDSAKTFPTNQPLSTSPTIKTCDGFRNLYLNGMMFRTPTDTMLSIANRAIEGQAKLEVIPMDSHRYFEHHDDRMYGEFLKNNKFLTLRINLPYYIETKEDINWTLSEPIWNSTDPRYRIVQGNTNFKYHHTMSVHMLFQYDVKEPYKVFLPMHQPLIHAIAHTEKKLRIHNHLISKEEYDNKINRSIPGKFSKVTKFLKEHEKEKAKCPVSQWMR